MSRNGIIVDIETCHPDAEIPEYQNRGDAGMDLKAVEKIPNKETPSLGLWFKTGLKISLPDGYVGLIYPRSSITEKDLELGNSVGVIDSGYTGEIQVRFNKILRIDHKQYPGWYTKKHYRVGDRVAQLIIMPYPKVSFREVDDLEDSERGSQGFGSTGN